MVGWAKSPAAADDMTRRPRPTLPTRSNGEVQQRGQRRMTIRAMRLLGAMRLCPLQVSQYCPRLFRRHRSLRERQAKPLPHIEESLGEAVDKGVGVERRRRDAQP